MCQWFERTSSCPSTSYLCLHSLLAFNFSYILHLEALYSSPPVCCVEMVWSGKAVSQWDLRWVLTKWIGSFFEPRSKSCWERLSSMYTTAEQGFCAWNWKCCWEGFNLYRGMLTDKNEHTVWDKESIRNKNTAFRKFKSWSWPEK